MAEAARHLRQHPPVGPRLTGRPQERALARNTALRVGDGAVLLAPGEGRQTNAGDVDGVVAGDVVGDDEQLQPAHRLAHGVGAWQADGRIGADHPQRLDLTCRDGLEQPHRLVAFGRRHVGRLPEARDAIPFGRAIAHVRGQHVGEAADLAPAHRIGLTGERQRTRALAADATARQMAIEDGVDLVGADHALVDALREARHHARRRRPPVVEALDIGYGEIGRGRDGGDAAGDVARVGERLGQVAGVIADGAPVEAAVIGEPDQ